MKKSDFHYPPCTLNPAFIPRVAEIAGLVGQLSVQCKTGRSLRLRRIHRRCRRLAYWWRGVMGGGEVDHAAPQSDWVPQLIFGELRIADTDRFLEGTT